MASVAYLIEPVLTTVTDIDYLDDLRSQTRIEHVTLAQLGLEVGATSKHETGYVDLVIRNEVLNRQLGHLPDVIVALLVTKTRETQGGLTTTSVLLREVDSELVNDFARVSRDGTKECTITVHDDEPELRVRLEEFLKGLRMELVVAEIQRPTGRFETIQWEYKRRRTC